MRLYSTAESVYKGEISLLAIVETIFATSVAVCISLKFNNFKWIAWAVVIAPFLLLRTELSLEIGIVFFESLWERDYMSFDEKFEHWYFHGIVIMTFFISPLFLVISFCLFRAMLSGWISLLASLLLFLVVHTVGLEIHCAMLKQQRTPTVSAWKSILENTSNSIGFLVYYRLVTILSYSCIIFFVRIVAIIAAIGIIPLSAFTGIPKNWARAVLSEDAFRPPEILPGYHIHGNMRIVKWPALSSLHLALYVPSLLYRWSMKATAIVYTPFLWLAWTTFREIPNLKRLRESDFTRVVVAYSFVVIAGFGLKLILMMKWNNFAVWWNQNPLTHFLAIYVVPAKIPLWQLTALINGIWAIIVFVFAKAAFTRIDDGKPWSTRHVELFLRVSWLGRGVLTLYTVLCTVYLTYEGAHTWNFPTVDWKPFPWW